MTDLAQKPADRFTAPARRRPALAWLARPSVSLTLVALVALAWGLGGGADRYLLFIATQYFAFVIAAAGLNILFGYSGLVSLGHGAFFAIGAYGVGWGLLNTGVPFFALLFLTVAIIVLLSLVLVLPTLRVQGHFLAMVTVAYASVVFVILLNWNSVTGGPLGMSLSPRKLRSWVPAEETLYALTVAFALAALLFMARVRSSSVGRAWRTMRQSEVAASCLGVPVRRYRVLAFAVSAGMVGLGGILHGVNVGYLTPSEYDVMLSINLFFAVLIGGSGRVWGPVLGSAVVVVGPELLRFLGDHRELALGLLLIAILSFQRGGVVGAVEAGSRAVRVRREAFASRRAPGVITTEDAA